MQDVIYFYAYIGYLQISLLTENKNKHQLGPIQIKLKQNQTQLNPVFLSNRIEGRTRVN